MIFSGSKSHSTNDIKNLLLPYLKLFNQIKEGFSRFKISLGGIDTIFQ